MYKNVLIINEKTDLAETYEILIPLFRNHIITIAKILKSRQNNLLVQDYHICRKAPSFNNKFSRIAQPLRWRDELKRSRFFQ